MLHRTRVARHPAPFREIGAFHGGSTQVPSSYLTVACLLWEHFVEDAQLQFQDTPELLAGGVVVEVQMPGRVQPLLGTEQGNLVHAVFLADMRDCHSIHFIISEKNRVFKTGCNLTECFGISCQGIKVTSWISKHAFP